MVLALIIALATASCEAGKDIYFSRQSTKSLPHLTKAWALATTTLLLMLATLAFTGYKAPQPGFWPAVAAHSALMAVATMLYMRALAMGNVSQTQPILALTPVFVLVTGPFMTGESVSGGGMLGVMLVAAGIYATQYPPKGHKRVAWWEPFAELVRQPGVRSKLGVALIYAVTANLDRMCLNHASPLVYITVDYALVTAALSLILVIGHLRGQKLSARDTAMATPGGMVNAVTATLHMVGLGYLPVPYLIALKRLSIVGVSLWGYYVRRERQPQWYHLAGMLMVVVGATVIMLSK